MIQKPTIQTNVKTLLIPKIGSTGEKKQSNYLTTHTVCRYKICKTQFPLNITAQNSIDELFRCDKRKKRYEMGNFQNTMRLHC